MTARPEPWGEDDDCCDTDPYPGEEDEESFQYRRTCGACGREWWSNHCEHDRIQRKCADCGWRPPGTFTPLERLGFEAAPADTVKPITVEE